MFFFHFQADIDCKTKEKLPYWAFSLNIDMLEMTCDHLSEKQNNLESELDTVYGRTASEAKGKLNDASLKSLKIVFKHLLSGLANANYPGNKKIGIHERPSILWERFALHYLRWINDDSSITYSAPGGKDDKGVDIEINDKDQYTIVQVKRGTFFQKGKGPRIVRELFGSMGLYKNAKQGIIFTNEEKHNVYKKAVEDHIQIYRENGFKLSIICLNDIRDYVENPTVNADLLRIFLNQFLEQEFKHLKTKLKFF